MPRKSPILQVTEIDGDQFQDLQSAQRAALPFVADNLQAVIKNLMRRGSLVVANGKLIPAEKISDER